MIGAFLELAGNAIDYVFLLFQVRRRCYNED